MNKITPPPFPLNAFKDFISTTIGVSIVYKEYQDQFLRRDVQDMYLGAKWVWSCLTLNFEERVNELAKREIDKTLSFNNRTRTDYTEGQLKSMLDIKRKYIADNHTKVLNQLFDAQIFSANESDFIASTFKFPVLPRGCGKTSLMEAMTEDVLEHIKEKIASAPVTPAYEDIGLNTFGERNKPFGHKHVLVLKNRPNQILSYIKRHTHNDDYVQKHVNLLNDKDNFMET